MFKDYYNYKKKKKRVRWVYDADLSEWKREAPTSYSDNFLDRYILGWIALVNFVFILIYMFHKIPFSQQLAVNILDSSLLMICWGVYLLGMLLIGLFIKRFFSGFLMCSLLSTLVFFASDMLLLNYDRSLYIYVGIALAVSGVFMLIVQFVRFLLRREPR